MTWAFLADTSFMPSLLSRPNLIGPLKAGVGGVIAGALFIALLNSGSTRGGHGGAGALVLWLLVVSAVCVAGLVGLVMTIRKASRRIGLLTLSAAIGLLIGLVALVD
jgi:hypothetical protein